MAKYLIFMLALTGCFGERLPQNSDDAGYGKLPDMSPACVSNNDGVIERGELVFANGIEIRYLANPAGTTVGVQPESFDLTSTAGEVHALMLEPMAGQWFAQAFPTATYFTVSDLPSGTLGIFRVTDSELQILGFASRTPNRTLLVYDQPIASLRFPVKLGDAWVTSGKIVNGILEGQPYAGSDTYKVTVAARGRALLPFLAFDNTLRVHVELTQTLAGGVAVIRQQHLFFHECFGELGRMVSPIGQTSPNFTEAAEFRRLAL